MAEEHFDKRGPLSVCVCGVRSGDTEVSVAAVWREQSTTQDQIWALALQWEGSHWTNTESLPLF